MPGENASVVVQMGSDDSVAVLIGLDKKVIALGGRHNIISLDTVSLFFNVFFSFRLSTSCILTLFVGVVELSCYV